MDYSNNFINDYYLNQIHPYLLHLFFNFKSLSFIFKNLLIKNLRKFHHFNILAFQFPQNQKLEA